MMKYRLFSQLQGPFSLDKRNQLFHLDHKGHQGQDYSELLNLYYNKTSVDTSLILKWSKINFLRLRLDGRVRKPFPCPSRGTVTPRWWVNTPTVVLLGPEPGITPECKSGDLFLFRKYVRSLVADTQCRPDHDFFSGPGIVFCFRRNNTTLVFIRRKEKSQSIL